MLRCHNAGEDHCLGLLNLRNTPQEYMTTSPAQRLFGRRTKRMVPTTFQLLKPLATDEIDNDKIQLQMKRTKVAENYLNRQTLKPLQIGDCVRMQPIDRTTKQATVTQRLKNRAYEVATNHGKTYRRNRVFLRSVLNNTIPSHQYSAEAAPQYPINTSDDSPPVESMSP